MVCLVPRRFGSIYDLSIKLLLFSSLKYKFNTGHYLHYPYVNYPQAGNRNPAELTKVIHPRIVNRVGKDVVLASLTGVITDTDVDVIRQLREEVALANMAPSIPNLKGMNMPEHDGVKKVSEYYLFHSISYYNRTSNRAGSVYDSTLLVMR